MSSVETVEWESHQSSIKYYYPFHQYYSNNLVKFWIVVFGFLCMYTKTLNQRIHVWLLMHVYRKQIVTIPNLDELGRTVTAQWNSDIVVFTSFTWNKFLFWFLVTCTDASNQHRTTYSSKAQITVVATKYQRFDVFGLFFHCMPHYNFHLLRHHFPQLFRSTPKYISLSSFKTVTKHVTEAIKMDLPTIPATSIVVLAENGSVVEKYAPGNLTSGVATPIFLTICGN